MNIVTATPSDLSDIVALLKLYRSAIATELADGYAQLVDGARSMTACRGAICGSRPITRCIWKAC